MTTAQKVADWLTSCDKEDARPVKVTINSKTYEGAIYINWDGKEAIYLVGSHPLIYRKGKKPYLRKGVCFRIEGDERDWYIGSYWHPELQERIFKRKFDGHDQYHPFGHSFILFPWQIENKPENKIDTYEPKAYERRPITVQAA